MTDIPDNPKDATEALILELTDKYFPDYKRSVKWNFRLWLSCQFFALIAGFGT